MSAISMNGLRQEIIFTIDKNIDENKLDFSNAVRKNRILTIRDYYLGILETDTNKFHKITKTKKYSYKYIDKDHINIYCNNRNYVYDLNNYKIEYTNVFDKIIMFSNGYKTIRNNSKYCSVILKTILNKRNIILNYIFICQQFEEVRLSYILHFLFSILYFL